MQVFDFFWRGICGGFIFFWSFSRHAARVARLSANVCLPAFDGAYLIQRQSIFLKTLYTCLLWQTSQ